MKAWLFAFATLIILWAFWHDLQDRQADEEIQQEWPIEYDAPQKRGTILVYHYNTITNTDTSWSTTR